MVGYKIVVFLVDFPLTPHTSLVAVDPSAKGLTFCGFSGKPNDFNQTVKE